jgi:putative addiction module component (TIGR02574 family)
VTERVRKLLAELTELPVDERLELVTELARTLPIDEDDDEIEDDELDRRMERIRQGTAKLTPADEVFDRLLARYAKT